MPTFRNAARLADIHSNPHVAIVSYEGPYTAMTIYGRARVADAPNDEFVTVEVVPDRIYAIRPPDDHHGPGEAT